MYDIIKYIGAFVSVLGGVDAVVFFSEKPEACKGLIMDICEKLSFLGLRSKKDVDAKGTLWYLSKNDSRLKAFCLRYDKWKVMHENVKGLVEQRRV